LCLSKEKEHLTFAYRERWAQLDVIRRLPRKITPVAKMLASVVPSLLANIPPIRGVQVPFRLKADIKRLNSVLEVPSSLDSRDLRGARVYEALLRRKLEAFTKESDILMTSNA
jgi:hypothetical protein